MGDKPNPVPNPNTCFDPWWAGGMQPTQIKVVVSECLYLQPGTEWPAVSPNGVWFLDFVTCGSYRLISDTWRFDVDFSWFDNEIYLRISFDPLGIFWRFQGNRDPLTGSLTSVYNTYWSDGSFLLDAYQSGGGLPASWDGGLLMGAPAVDPYKAEELPTTLTARKTRIACHRDGTNIKIYGDY